MKLLAVKVRFRGQQNQLFTAGLISQGDHGMAVLGPDIANHFFQGGQGHHFGANFGKAFGPTENGDKALIIDIDDIAGIVPAAIGWLQDARVIIFKIAHHDIGTTDKKPAALSAAGDWFEPSKSQVMINYRVDDLVGLLEQLTAAGIATVKGPDEEFNGKFAWVMDPEGNKVELWEPAEPA